MEFYVKSAIGLIFLCWFGASLSCTSPSDEEKTKEIDDGSLVSVDGSARIFTSEPFQWAGETLDGYAHGTGEISWEQGGRVYQGDVDHGRITGRGALYVDGFLLYEGDFVDGVREGNGEQYTSGEDRRLIYSGQFHDGTWHGKGMTYYADGSIFYRGNFKKGEKTGYGTMYNSNGTIYRQGVFDDGEFLDENQYYRVAADIGHAVVEEYFDGGIDENIDLLSARISEDQVRKEVVFRLSFDGNWDRSNHYVCTIKAFNYGSGIEMLEMNSTAQDYFDLKRGFLTGIAVAAFFSELGD